MEFRRSILSAVLALSLGACSTAAESPTPRSAMSPTSSLASSLGSTRRAAPKPSPDSAAENEEAEPAPEASDSDVQAASEKEREAYHEIYSLFTRGGHEAAMVKAQEFEARYPQSALLPQVQNVHGLIYLFSKQPLQAQSFFRKALLANSDRRFRQFLLYNQASALAETESYQDSMNALDEIHPDQLDSLTQIKFHYLRAQLKERLGAPTESARALLLGSQLIHDLLDPNRRLYETQLDMALKEIKDYPVLESLAREGQTSFLAPLVLLRLAKSAMETGRNPLAEANIRSLETQYPDTPQAQEGKELLSTLRKLNDVSGRSVGVLLPMTGKYSRFGSQCRQGIELAFGKASSTLVFGDSGETAESAVTALDQLVLDKGVIAVIGPLLSKGIEKVSARAEELGVPLLTLSQQPGVKGEYVFQTAVTSNQQIDEITNYAVKQLGFKRFAVLFPKEKFGEDYARAFWSKIQALGGEVTGYEGYTPKETDFRQVIDKISGLYYKDARTRELNELAQLRKDNKITKRNRKTETYYALKPIVDYDAVFIPDEAKVVGQILPTFLYRDVDSVKFLGISTWNSPSLAERVGSQGESTFFVDDFFVDSLAPELRDFIQHYQDAYDVKPSAMEATAYDAASVVNSILKKNPGNLSRGQIRELLIQIKNFRGATGHLTYADGEFKRPLRILTVTRGQITEVKTPPQN